MNLQVLLLCFINIFSAMGYSLIAPLLPTLGAEKNFSEDLMGIIISVFAWFNFLVTPFCPFLITKFGRKNIFYFAVLSEATCTLIYGFLEHIPSYILVVIIIFLCRTIHGIGSGITATLVYSLASTVSSPEEVQTSLGLLEVSWSWGLAIGPWAASLFYYFGGYPWAFYVVGITLYIGWFCIKVLKINLDTNGDNSNTSIISSFWNIDIILNFIPIIILIMGNSYYFPSWTNHLTMKWGCSVEVASMFFIINMVFNFVVLQFLNEITDRFGWTGTITLGCVWLTVGPLFVYPMAFLPQFLITIAIGLAMLGIAGTFINVPCIVFFAKIIKNNNKTWDDNSVNDWASVLYNWGLNIGDFIGPILGGFLSTKYGFKYSNVWMSIISGVYFVLYSTFYFRIILEEVKKGGNNDNDNGQHENWISTGTYDHGAEETTMKKRRRLTMNLGRHSRVNSRWYLNRLNMSEDLNESVRSF